MGHGSGSGCFDEGFLGFLLRDEGSGLLSSQVPDRSAAVGLSLDRKLLSEEGRGDIGNAGVSVEMLGPLLMAEVSQLDRVLSSIEYNRKEQLSSTVFWKLWMVGSSGGSGSREEKSL